ncbi:MAG: 4'-phosphopantetheinyl transferase superfamily protein [Polyangiales bacterium]
MHRRVDDPDLLPPTARRHSVAVDLHDAAHDVDAHFPGVALPEGAQGWARKRRIEALAGRLCAREALRALGSPHADAPIAADASRAPVWPPGVVGSITHTQGFASAAVAHAGELRALGIDSEERFTLDRARRLDGHLAHPGEVARLTREGALDEADAATVVFSAKESVFKCLHPSVRRYFGFHAARVVDAAGGVLVIRLTEGLTAEFAEGHELRGRYAVTETHVHTAVSLPWRLGAGGW